MVENEGHFVNKNGQRIYTRAWLPSTEKRALVILLHGLGEHCGRYGHVAAALTGAHFGVLALDHRGHGKSDGPRAAIKNFDDYVADVEQFVESQKAVHPQVPCAIFGHSMGGAIALKCALAFPQHFSAMVVTAPAIKLSGDLAPWLQKVAGVLAAVVPRLPVEKIETAFLSRDPEIVRQYETDPLVFHGKVSARTGAQLLRAGATLSANLHKITLPFWAGQGMADRLIDPVGVQWLYQRAQSTDKTLREYDGLAHEILNEPEKEDILLEIVSWLSERL